MATKEDNFFNIVQETAKSQSAVFFMKNGEGREILTDNFDGEDLYGWLVPLENVATFKKELENSEPSEKWDKFLTFAIWKKEKENLFIDFKSNF